jgi:hypothetical protein
MTPWVDDTPAMRQVDEGSAGLSGANRESRAALAIREAKDGPVPRLQGIATIRSPACVFSAANLVAPDPT